ncbi:hypothetical protein [Streptomyces sp. NPDC002324]
MTLPEIPELSQLTHQIGQAPSWAMSAVLVAATFALLALYTVIRRRGRGGPHAPISASQNGRGEAVRATVAAAGPLAILGACGMLVSLYGLYGFATESMELPVVFAVPFMAIWDLAEATCFVSLYRSALVESRWTRPMRRTRRMAWGLVTASAAMNAAHAPGNWVSMVAFALVPPVSAKLIEHELDKQMSANSDEDEEDVTPGMVRLLQLGYVHVWAQVFAQLGLDATSRDGVIHQDARIRRAARKIHELGMALDRADALREAPEVAGGRKAQRDHESKLKKAATAAEVLRGKAELAIDVAGIAGDTPAQLMLARHLTARGRVADLARMDKADPMGMVAMLEDLSIVPSVAALEEGARAAQAKKEREQAEQARDKALAEQAEAERVAEEIRRQAADEVAQAKTTLEQAREASADARRGAQEAAEKRAEAEEVYQRVEAERDRLAGEIEQLRTRAGQLKTNVKASESRERGLRDEVSALQTRADELRDEVNGQQRRVDEARLKARRAEEVQSSADSNVERAQRRVNELAEQYTAIEGQIRRLAEQRQEKITEVEDLASEKEQAEDEARRANERAAAALAQAKEAEGQRNTAYVALQVARDELLEALTSPEEPTAPRWTSQAKVRGWELYLHTVHTEGREPTDQELAGDERDASTARRWLSDFRAELARHQVIALPAQQGARDRTTVREPALA